jgi:hypothetical protein
MSQSRYVEWFGIAVSPRVMRRSACYAIVVGSLLILINHGACILDEMYTPECFLQSILSVIVPYIVVTVSSVQATISNQGNVK